MRDSIEFALTFVAFAVSRTDFYSLTRRKFFSRSLMYLYCACTILFRAKCFAFRREKAFVESGLHVNVAESQLLKHAWKFRKYPSILHDILYINSPSFNFNSFLLARALCPGEPYRFRHTFLADVRFPIALIATK
jgi:hypothetical protein